MIIRIVKMHFRQGTEDEFLTLFHKSVDLIRAFEGVEKLELYRDVNDPSVFFTYSFWTDLHSLDAYRRSELFRNVWTQTRSLFQEKAEAWSVDRLVSR